MPFDMTFRLSEARQNETQPHLGIRLICVDSCVLASLTKGNQTASYEFPLSSGPETPFTLRLWVGPRKNLWPFSYSFE